MLQKTIQAVQTIKPTLTGIGSMTLLNAIDPGTVQDIASEDKAKAICQTIVTLVTVVAQLVSIFKSFKKNKNVPQTQEK